MKERERSRHGLDDGRFVLLECDYHSVDSVSLEIKRASCTLAGLLNQRRRRARPVTGEQRGLAWFASNRARQGGSPGLNF